MSVEVSSAQSFPSPIYSESVLAPNFEDAKKYFLDSLIQIHYAHTRMLAKQRILTEAEERTLIRALDSLDRGRIEHAKYDGRYEDLFFFVEASLEMSCGEVAGKMHTARSRNDIAITLYRMAVRQQLLKLASAILETREVLLDLAQRHHDTIMPAHTHTQPAQPTTLAHYLLAAAEFLGRDLARIEGAFARVNLSPMGACAITTTGFPIDRHETARLLGFEGLAENSYGAIAAIDYMTESASVVIVAMTNLGKFIQDLLLWSTREFGFLRLSDAFVQPSSIMPQKRNPVALEHTRVLASRAMGHAQAIITCAHNTPFGDINDGEDDLQPLVFAMFIDALRTLKLLTATLRTAEFDRALLAARADKNFLTVTELADTLVRSEGMTFRDAHSLVTSAVKSCGENDDPKAIASALVTLKPHLKLTRDQIEQALDPRHFIEIRRVEGGPAPEETARGLERARALQEGIVTWLKSKTSLLEEAAASQRASMR